MIRIAICDDTESDIEPIKIHINRYATNEALKVFIWFARGCHFYQ